MVHKIGTATFVFLVLALCLSVPSAYACGMKAGKAVKGSAVKGTVVDANATSINTPSVSVA